MPDTPTPDRLLALFAEQTHEHAILLLDREGFIAWWSPGAERIFAIPAADAVGQHASIVFTPDEIARGLPEYELAVARTQTAAEDDRWLRRGDGSRFWGMGVMVPLRDDAGECIGFCKVVRNRTDIREQLDTLVNRADAAEAESRRKDVFLSTLSHELRNPLAPLTNAVEIIRMTAAGSAELETSLRIMERQLANLRRLVDDLLDVARVASGKLELAKARIALDEILQRAIETTRPLVEQRRHRLELLMPPSPITVEGDAHRLTQVFVNLLHNAAKYTPEEGRIWVKATTEGDDAVVHVEDDGIGIPHDMLPRIFKLFTQVETSRDRSQGGLGIGLSLVRQLVVMHSGSVQVRSDGPGKGCQFTVRLPLAR